MMRRFTGAHDSTMLRGGNNNNMIESVISINHDDPYGESRRRESTVVIPLLFTIYR